MPLIPFRPLKHIAFSTQNAVATLMAVCGLFTGSPAPAHAGDAPRNPLDGSCAGVDLSRYFDETGRGEGPRVWTLDEGVPIFATEADATPFDHLPFSQPLALEGMGAERLLARYPGAGDALFWIDRSTVMCRSTPLTDPKTNVEKKVFIRTETRLKDDRGSAVAAYPNRDLTGCTGDSCRRLSRFELYFVLSETEDAYLVGQHLTWEDARQKLVGWVPKDEAIAWNWAVGLRPQLDLVAPDGGTGSVCAYVSMEDARNRTDCQPILGGPEWFRFASRLPVIAEHRDMWEIAAPGAGVATTARSANAVMVDPASFGDTPTGPIGSFKSIDLFFLIDGTRSMTPYIDGLVGRGDGPGLIERIRGALAEKFGRGASLRFGFRIYRDTTAEGGESIGEGMPLDGEACGTLSQSALDDNHRRFTDRLSDVETTGERGDDYYEDLLAGIDQASKDMSGCDDHLKLLFVIGDAGYDAERQIRVQGAALTPERAFARFDGFDKGLAFFARAPRDPAIQHPAALGAWDAFEADAMAMLGGSKSLAEIDAEPQTFFLDIAPGAAGSDAFLEALVARVDAVTQPDILTDITIDLRGGAALESVIARLRDGNVDVPGFFWKMVERSACDDLGQQCHEGIYTGVQRLFIPFSDDLELEIWMTRDELSDWRRFIDAALDTESALRERRVALVSAMTKSLEDILGEPQYDGLVPIADWLERYSGVPGRFRSPLLAYSAVELENRDIVPRCELDRLFNWLKAVRGILYEVDDGNLAQFTALPDGALGPCPGLSEKGAAIPAVDPFSVEALPPGPTRDFSLATTSSGRRIYWVPQRYLP